MKSNPNKWHDLTKGEPQMTHTNAQNTHKHCNIGGGGISQAK